MADMHRGYKILRVEKFRKKGVRNIFYRCILEGLPEGHNCVTLPSSEFFNQNPKEGKFALYALPKGCVSGTPHDYRWYIVNKQLEDNENIK